MRVSSFGVLALALLALPAQALASGYIPGPPVAPKTFPSFAACKAELDRRHAEDMEGAGATPEPIENGGTRQKLVETKGVVSLGPSQAAYDAIVGYQIRFIDRARDSIVTNFSYQDVKLLCKGRVLTSTYGAGYYLPGYERLREGQTTIDPPAPK